MNSDPHNKRRRAELLANEFLAQQRDDEEFGLDEFVNQYPDIADEIRRLVLDHMGLGDLTLGGFEQTSVPGKSNYSSGGDDSDAWPQFDDYRIFREIARGGMGIVYEAEQISLGRRVALKTLRGNHSPDSIAQQRFQIEAKAAAQLHHSNIVPVHEVGQEQDISFFAMQYIDGCGLDQVIRLLALRSTSGERLSSVRNSLDGSSEPAGGSPLDGSSLVVLTVRHDSTASVHTNPDSLAEDDDFEVAMSETAIHQSAAKNEKTQESVPDLPPGKSKKKRTAPKQRSYWRSVARIGEQIAEALHYAHERGVIHRDVKPSNLILDKNGVVWISDFGLAKMEEQGLTEADDLVGTLMYMSPERFDGFCDIRSDIYSLGLTLYELLVLVPAFRVKSKLEILKCIRDTEPRRLRSIDPGIPRDLQTIIRKAIAKDPARRYQTADAMAKDLGRFIEGRPIRARHVPTMERAVIWSRRNPLVACLAGAFLLVAIATLIGSMTAAIAFRQMAINQKQLAQTATQAEARAIESNKQAREAELAATAAANRATEAATENALNLYYAEMKLAVDAVADPNGVRQTRRILDRWIPDETEDVERRGWEWYLLDSIVNPKTTIIETDRGGVCLDTQWSPDGRQIVWAAGSDVFVGDFPDFKNIRVFRDHSNYVTTVRFSPDGSLLATGSEDCQLRIRDLQNESVVFEADYPTPPGSVCWSPDGSTLVVQVFDRGHKGLGFIQVLETTEWKEIHRIEAPDNNELHRFCFDPKGKFLATRYLRKIRILETENWSLVQEKQIHNGVIVGLAWHPTRPWIATASRDGWSKIWDIEQDTVTDLLRGREQAGIDWHPSGDRLAVGNWDYGIRILRPAEQQIEVVLNGHAEWVNTVAWHPNQGMLASSSSDGTTRIWDLATPTATRVFRQLETQENLWSTADVHWSPDGKMIATEVDGRIIIRDSITGSPRLDGEQTATLNGNSISWSNSGEHFATRQRDQATLWNRDVSQHIRSTTIDRISMGSFHPAGNRIILVDTGEINDAWQLKVWNVDSGEVVELGPKHEGQHTVMPVWNPDGSLLATAAAGNVYIVESATGAVVKTFDASARNIIAITWSPDGKKLALAGRDQQIVIRDTSIWEQTKVYSGHTYRVVCLDWSPDGTRLASGSLDRSVRVWDTQTGQSTIKLQHDSPVRGVQWSSDSMQLASISDDGVTKIWDATSSYQRSQSELPKLRFDDVGVTITRH